MDDARLYQRLALIEHQLRVISQHLGIPFPAPDAPGAAGPVGWGSSDPGLTAEVVQLARSGKAIEAIKLYRELTGASLVEAKAAVDSVL